MVQYFEEKLLDFSICILFGIINCAKNFYVKIAKL